MRKSVVWWLPEGDGVLSVLLPLSVGLFPFVPASAGSTLHFSLPATAFSLVVRAAYFYGMIHVGAIKDINSGSGLMVLLQDLLPIMDVSTLAVVLLWVGLHRRRLTNAYEELADLRRQTFAKPVRRSTASTVFFLYSLTAPFTIFYFLESFESAVIFFTSALQRAILVSQLVSFLDVLEREFVSLTEGLNRHNAEARVELVRRLALSGQRLISCFSPHLILLTFRVYLAYIFHVYKAVHDFMKFSVTDYTTIRITIFEIVLLLYFLKSLVQIDNQAKQFNEKLYRLVLSDKTTDLINNEKVILHLSGKKQVDFCKIGFVSLDYTVVCPMVSTATTYILVLLEYSQPA